MITDAATGNANVKALVYVDAFAPKEGEWSYPGFAPCFANDLPAAQAAELQATQRPIAVGAITDKSSAPAWATIPSWYLLGTADHVILPAEQLFMAERAHAHIVTVKASTCR